MKKRVASVLAAAALLTVTAGGFGSTASADAGGEPNRKACFGQVTSFAATELGLNPSQRATGGTSVQVIQKDTKAQFEGVPVCPF